MQKNVKLLVYKTRFDNQIWPCTVCECLICLNESIKDKKSLFLLIKMMEISHVIAFVYSKCVFSALLA